MDIEQSTLLWIMRVIFFIIALVLSYGVWSFMRRERTVILPAKPAYQPPTDIALPEKVITLLVMPQPGHFFDHMMLFDVMQQLGFVYADTEVFEYHVPDSKYIAFSIIDLRQPYTFSQNPQPGRLISGLRAVLQLPVADGDNQMAYFHLMLSVLDELSTKLDGCLCDANNYPLKDKKVYEIQKSVESFEQTYTTLIQNGYHRTH